MTSEEVVLLRCGLGWAKERKKRRERWAAGGKKEWARGERWHGSRGLGFGFIFKNSFSFLFKTVLQI
jgi:hypothetical protein